MLVSQAWLIDLGSVIGYYAAATVILFIALIPGFLNMFLLTSLILDKPGDLNLDVVYPPISILIAAFNEENTLPDTFMSLAQSDYPSEIEIILIDDGSDDGTLEIARRQGPPGIIILTPGHGGKASALNAGLKRATHEIVMTIDADTYLHPQALKRLIARFLQSPTNTAAVAGSVLARNSRANTITRMQEWDYFIAINSVKRQQALYQGTLVAQGAFSAYLKKNLLEGGGWPDVIGEDIVLTWDLLSKGHPIGFEPTAVGFTNVPTSIGGFYRQRKRWARGMIEGLKIHGRIYRWSRARLAELFVVIDFLFPFMDFGYTFIFIPGVVLAMFGHYYIAGPITLLVMPITFSIIFVMFLKERRIFNQLGLKVRRGRLGVILYALFYQVIMSPVCVVGYVQEIFGFSRKW
jgi:poly-beta-1,6-N-acetyl-D-glucosamine synthase